MTKFILWHKCDWCGKWTMFPFAWVNKEDKEYCSQICADKKTQVMDFHGRKE